MSFQVFLDHNYVHGRNTLPILCTEHYTIHQLPYGWKWINNFWADQNFDMVNFWKYKILVKILLPLEVFNEINESNVVGKFVFFQRYQIIFDRKIDYS